jgi:DNA-directed RNA polymerase specialized sigma24 family protein
MLNAKKGLSSCQAARDLDMHQKTVWSMMNRIRKAMETDEMSLLKDIVEIENKKTILHLRI